MEPGAELADRFPGAREVGAPCGMMFLRLLPTGTEVPPLERPPEEDARHEESMTRSIIRYDPRNEESPTSALEARVTAVEATYIRSNFGVPVLRADHAIEISGAVDRPTRWTAAELGRRAQRTSTVTMECAGNDRTAMRPLPSGEPWGGGAISTSRWTGVPLAELLAEAGPGVEASGVVVTGADVGTPTGADAATPFARALPWEAALGGGALLAMTMNGAPLPPEHGAPVRLVVPGWYGMASVKWVTRVEVVTRPFDGYFQRERYVYDLGNVVEPVTRMRVKSMITSPAAGAIVSAGPVEVRGWAWSGNGEIAGVEVSSSESGRWVEAELCRGASDHEWTGWHVSLDLARGRHILRSRARDSSGASQPEVPPWNRLGYGNNAMRQVVVEVLPAAVPED